MKMKSLALASIVAISTATTSQAALTLMFEETGGNTVVTLEGTAFTTMGLTSTASNRSASSLISPTSGNVVFTGNSDSFTRLENFFVIPTFTFGNGVTDSGATNLGANNPFINIVGSISGQGRIYVDNDNPLPTDFTATATYSGTLADNGIDDTFQSFTFANGQVFTIGTAVPEPSSTALLGLGSLALILRRRK